LCRKLLERCTTIQTCDPNSRHSLPIVRPAPGKKLPAIKTQARAATILPNFVGLRFQVYNGKVYNDFTVTEQMVGHKLGEFSPYALPYSRYPKAGTNREQDTEAVHLV
jgi:ribosomal protein S19